MSIIIIGGKDKCAEDLLNLSLSGNLLKSIFMMK